VFLNGNGNEEFGLARLEELVIRHQQECASAILNAIYQTILAFGDQSRWQDDVTVVVIKKWLDDFPTKGFPQFLSCRGVIGAGLRSEPPL
jgi:hypothetical protein